ncbi:MAG TPA: hypothetical protein VHJ20_11900 [Polyangia bacterium]|nr:hypothetical protein [Polyangia bacterium]
MTSRARPPLAFAGSLLLAFVLLLPARTARAQCCPGYSPATACAGETLTKSRWCIQDTAPTGQAALPKAFCAYGDKVVTTLESVFNIKAPDVFEFELDTQTGGAHTGTACGHLGDGVAYDAFVGKAYGATSFWGYLLSLHEAINDWTGMSSSGWPTDWWADHQSAFPNLMDFHVMNTIGVANADQNLITSAAAQKKRFYPGGDSADAKVVALDNVYLAMPNGDGYAGFSHLFAMQSGMGVKWDNLGVPNPDVKRSEYVAAYMSLAMGKPALPLLQGPGTNGGGKICNDTPDGTPTDKPYTCSEDVIDAIANAHCGASANGKKAADMQALRSGNYAAVASGPCGATCPSECGCSANNHCVAAWLAANATPTGGTSGGGTGGNNGGSSGHGGSTGAGGATATGGEPGSTGTGGGTSGATGGETGGVTAPGGQTGSTGGTTGTGGTIAVMTPDASLGGGGSTGGTPSEVMGAGGCACNAGGGATSSAASALFVAAAVAARKRRKRRS